MEALKFEKALNVLLKENNNCLYEYIKKMIDRMEISNEMKLQELKMLNKLRNLQTDIEIDFILKYDKNSNQTNNIERMQNEI